MDGIGEREKERERKQFLWHQTGLEKVTNVVVVTRVMNVTNRTSGNIFYIAFLALTSVNTYWADLPLVQPIPC